MKNEVDKVNNNKDIAIRCKGSRTLPYTRLQAFQGNLKDLSESRASELMEQIKTLGWIAPVFVYDDDKILDGHQRLAVLPALLEEGYTIGEIPVVDIDAETRQEAAKMLLAINSSYGQMTDDGLYEFMHDFDLNVGDLTEMELPDIDIDGFIEGYFADAPGEPDNKEDKKTSRECPECGHVF